MSTSANVMTGGCLCRSIRYEVTGEPQFAGLCYCADCRKSSGSAFVGFMGYAAENFKVTSGETRVFISASSSGTERAINFCEACGSHLFGGIVGKDDQHTVYVGSLDDEFMEEFKPKMAIFVGCRPSWGKLECELQEFEKM